jgi:hypothetical protein
MQAAEKALISVQLELRTRSSWPDGTVMTTRGSLRVLRGGQAAVHTRFEFQNDDGIRGRSESVQTADGIVLFEDDAAFGEVFVAIDKKLVADLEWAGDVLRKDGLPGMRDRRAEAPLGSGMLASLQTQFELAADARKERAGDAGQWFVGKRKKGLDADGGELPVADAVEVFVRDRDHALLEVKQSEGDKVVQHLVVETITVDAKLDPAQFKVGAGTGTPSPVQQHALGQQIEQTLKQAEAKKARELAARQEKDPAARDEKPEVRPSRR